MAANPTTTKPLTRIRIKLKAYDHRVIDGAAAKIFETAMATGAKVSEVATAPKIARVVDPVAGLTDEFMSGLSAYRAAYQAFKGLGGSASG